MKEVYTEQKVRDSASRIVISFPRATWRVIHSWCWTNWDFPLFYIYTTVTAKAKKTVIQKRSYLIILLPPTAICSFFNHFCTVRNVFVNVAGLTHLVMLCLEKNYSKLYGSKQSGMEWYSNPSCIKDVHSSAWTFCCMDLLPLIS